MQRYEFFIYIMVIVDKALMQVKKKTTNDNTR